MVYLALTPQGLREILDAPEAAKTPIWCSADALSEAEFKELERGNVTRFGYSFADADKATIQDALATIGEHHPGERIWIESTVFGTWTTLRQAEMGQYEIEMQSGDLIKIEASNVALATAGHSDSRWLEASASGREPPVVSASELSDQLIRWVGHHA